MSITRTRREARLASLLALLLAIGGLVALAPAAHADGDTPVTFGSLRWGFKASYRNYVGGMSDAPLGERVVVDAPATFDPPLDGVPQTVAEAKRPYRFLITGGSIDGGDIEATSEGGVVLDYPGHEVKVGISNLQVSIADGAMTLYADTDYEADVSGETPDGFPAGDIQATGVEFATGDAGAPSIVNGATVVEVTNVKMTAAGDAAMPLYGEGVDLDDLTLILNPTPTVSVSETTVSAEGTTTISVSGEFFDPNAVIGTRPPFLGQPTGYYVVFGKFADYWRPSEGAPADNRENTSQKWTLPQPSYGQLVGMGGNNAAQANLLLPDGSFTAELEVSKTAMDAKATDEILTNYGVYTYAAGGPNIAASETYTPIQFATSMSVTGPAQVTYGNAATYTATLSGPSSGSITMTGAGAAQTRPVDAQGQATFTLPAGLAVGAKNLTFTYAGEDGFAAASAQKPVSVAKATTSLVLKAPKKAKKVGKIKVTVQSNGATPSGKVRLVLKKKKKKMVRNVTLNKKGKAVIKLNKKQVRKLAKGKGKKWKGQVRFLATPTHQATSTKVVAKVKAKPKKPKATKVKFNIKK